MGVAGCQPVGALMIATVTQLEAVVRAVACSKPVYALTAWDDSKRRDACGLCDAVGVAPAEVKHKRTCPWVRARRLLDMG